MSKAYGFVFPGQGSQQVGMMQAFATESAIVKKVCSQASEILNYDVLELMLNGPSELLNQTIYTQPILLTASVAIWEAWREQSNHLPALMAGHSLGEYSALVCAEAIYFPDALKLVAKRAQLMQEAVPEEVGGMAAILGLTDEQVTEVCLAAKQDEVVEPVNFNSPGQVVIAGHRAAVERAMYFAKEKGAKLVKMLAVSAPSHCSLMRSAADEFAKYLENIVIHPPKISVINNVDVAAYTEPDAIKNALIRQLYNPVRWVETIQTIAAANINLLFECGPGRVLAGLNRRIVSDVTTLPLETPTQLQEGIKALD